MNQVLHRKLHIVLLYSPEFYSGKMCLLILLTGFITSNSVHSEELEEYQAKALLVYNFIKSTSWPEGSFKRIPHPLKLRLVGDQEFLNRSKVIRENESKVEL
jgi:hypothetical protein